ncbi:hypothetical protein B0H13DRAFT_1861010 [Mycena leptocephala]|nr:hypothetical protein B0H13DRAFT_1861010 [Mycena leptocephala]
MSNKLPYRTLVYANDTITASARRPSVTPLVILGDTFCGLRGPVTLLFKAVISFAEFEHNSCNISANNLLKAKYQMEEGHAGCKKVVGAHFVHWFPTITENSKLKSEAFGQYRNVISGIEAHKSVQESSRWHLSITCTTLEEVAKVVAEVAKAITEAVKVIAEVVKVAAEVAKVTSRG